MEKVENMEHLELKMEVKEVLLQLAKILQELTRDEYTQPIALLGNSSIGQHSRHIIELFQQLGQGYHSGVVNYDERERDIRLQEEIDFALESIGDIISGLNRAVKPLKIISVSDNQESGIASNYARELLYNLEHCVHHQAIIKIGLLCLEKPDIDDSFGVAKSTRIYHQQEAK